MSLYEKNVGWRITIDTNKSIQALAINRVKLATSASSGRIYAVLPHGASVASCHWGQEGITDYNTGLAF